MRAVEREVLEPGGALGDEGLEVAIAAAVPEGRERGAQRVLVTLAAIRRREQAVVDQPVDATSAGLPANADCAL